ncbi:MAG: hypothetical protein QG654_190 [Patescibacteria group bacterium]|nr:hypothetical protein [Patescibacteria group bacterium]
MESKPTSNLNEKREFTSKEEAIQKFFIENEIDKLTFSTQKEAESKVEEINSEYGDISFVAEDRGGFAIKFRDSHLGEGFEEYKSEEKGGEQNSDIEKAA